MLDKKIQKLMTWLLCVILAWTSVIPAYAGSPIMSDGMDETEILARYPNAKIIHVDQASYPELAEQLRSQGYESTTTLPVMQLASNDTVQTNGSVTIQKKASSSDCNSRSGPASTPGDESLRVMVDFSSDVMKSGSNNGDAAAIVFVIIGTVLIVVWALYVFKYLYDVATGFTPCGKWSDVVFTSSFISGNANQSANFNGVRYMTGYRDGATEFGISAELGYADILLNDVAIPELKGLYWFIGPVLRWRLSTGKNPHYFQMNFLAGSTEHDEMDVIAQANLGLQFGIGDTLRLGVSWGAMNINLNGDQGLISETDQYYYLYGLSMGFQF